MQPRSSWGVLQAVSWTVICVNEGVVGDALAVAQKSLEEVKGMHLSTWRRPATSAPAALGVQRTLRVMLAAQRRGNAPARARAYIVCVANKES